MKQAQLNWRDGEPVSSVFDDVYFSSAGGMAETEHVFLQANDLPARWRQAQAFVIGETGFGSGLNFLTTVHHWLQHSPADACLYYYAVEKYPLSADDLQRALQPYAELSGYLDELLQAYPPAIRGLHGRSLYQGRVRLLLLFEDVQQALAQLDVSVDAWYLDGFAPAKNPAMWSEPVFDQLARLSHAGSTLSTYTVAGFVRRGLLARGFDMHKVAGFGNKRQMLAGRMVNAPAKPVEQPWFDGAHVRAPAKTLAVIGAGIAGITTARALAQRGWRVTVFDQQQLADGASGNPLGVVLPRLSRQASAGQSFDNSAFACTVDQLDRLQACYPELGWLRSGVIQLPSSSRIASHMAQGDFDAPLARILDAEQLAGYCGLDIDSDGLLYPLAGYLSPRKLCQVLCEDAGPSLQLITATRIEQLHYDVGQWLLVDAHQQQRLACDAVVIANGAQLHQFSQTAELPISPVRGQLSYMPASSDSQQLRCPLCYEGYILPAQHGRHVIGASFRTDDDSTELLQDEHRENLAALHAWLPRLFSDSAVVDGRASVRAVTPDRLPLVGPVPDREYFYQHYRDLQRGRAAASYPAGRYLPGLYVNVGHGARGLTSSLLSAEMLAAQLNGEPSPVYKTVQDALHPARFMIRAFKKGKIVSS